MTAGRPDKSRSLYVARKPFVAELAQTCRAAQAAQAVSPAATRHALTEDAFLRAAVAMEGFLTEWIVRCASMDTTAMRATLEGRASNYLATQLPSWRTLPSEFQPTAAASIPLPRKLSQEKIRQLLGCELDNLSIHGVADIHTLAKENIADVRGTYVTKLTKGEAKVIDATIAIRNYLVHRTERARASVNGTLQATGMPAPLRRSQNLGSGDSVGRYLCVRSDGTRPRFEHFIEALGAVATKLAPYRGAPVKLCP